MGSGCSFHRVTPMAILLPPQPTFASPMYLATVPRNAIVVPIDLARDGRGGLAILDPDSGAVEFRRTSAMGKLRFGQRLSDNFAKDVVAGCALEGDVLLIVTKSGELRLDQGLNWKDKVRTNDSIVGLNGEMMRRVGTPIQIVSGVFRRGHGREALVIGKTGAAVLVERQQPRDLRWILSPAFISPKLEDYTWGSAGKWGDADGISWRDRFGNFCTIGVTEAAGGGLLFTKRQRSGQVREAGFLPVRGCFVKQGESDQSYAVDPLLWGRKVPAPEAAKLSDPDFRAHVCDMNGDKLDDLVLVRRARYGEAAKDVYVQFTGGERGSTSDDGLLDSWKSGAVLPGGLNLQSLGCSQGQVDIIAEVQRMEDVPEDKVRSEMDRVVKYFASLPIKNRDGSTGIHLHPIIREPIPLADAGKPWWELGDKYHPSSHRGITHWMMVSKGGGGQSGEMTDRGGCGINSMFAVFTHEFGHQLGLDHTGRWAPAWCPIYPSMMNYAYSYQLNGKYGDIGYSDGRLAGVTLDERRLDEYLPLPPDKVAFIAGPPYHFRLKPAPDGKGTLVDWNWNGVFGEKNISADINYGYSTTGGLRHTIGKSYTAPAAITLGKRLLIFSGDLLDGAAVPAADASATHPGLSKEQPGRLRARVWKGSDAATDGDKWSEPFEIEQQSVVGDPSVTRLDNAIWVSYPTPDGVHIRKAFFTATGYMALGPANVAIDSAGCEATLCAVGKELVLLLWRGADKDVSARIGRVSGGSVEFEAEVDLGFRSSAPVGAAAGETTRQGAALWIGLSTDQDEKRPLRWQVRQLRLLKGVLSAVSEEWVGGLKGGERGPNRIALLWEKNSSFPTGQLYLFGCGMNSKEAPWSCHYVCTRIADQTVNGGWLTRRYYDEWTTSRSGPGVCWFNNDIVFASRWFGNVHGTENDNLFVAFYGRGIESAPMGDFDDIGFIRDVGLVRSISFMGE